MPKYTFVPTSLPGPIRTTGAVNLTGGTNMVTVVTDALDTTYERCASLGNLPTDFIAGWPIFGNGERVVSVVPTCRAKNPGTKAAVVNVGAAIYNQAIVDGASLSLPTGVATPTNYALPPQNGQLLDPYYGVEWNRNFVDGPTITIRDQNVGGTPAYWYELGYIAYTTKAATIAAPAVTPLAGGSNTTTQYPTFAAVVSALVESWQVWSGGEFVTTGRVEFSVYRQADAPGAAPPVGVQPKLLQVVPFDLNTYIDGVTLSTLSVSLKVAAPLPDDSYAVFARVVRDHPSGSDSNAGTSQWSGYQKATWVQNVGGPTAPVIVLAADDAAQGVHVKATTAGPAGYAQTSSLVYVERLVGGLWRAVRGMQGVSLPVGVATWLGYDYEADRAATVNTYRLRHTMVLTADGTLASSPWATATVAGENPLGTGWNFKAVNLIAASWLSAGILTEPTESDQTQATIFYPLDRPCPVVVKGSAGGWAGSYDFIANGAAAVAAVRALTDYEGLVLVETAFGDSFYCSLTGMSVKRQGTSLAPRLAGTLTFAQVDCDLATES